MSAKILVVDDDQPVRSSIVGYLEDSGYDLIEAEDGEIALAMVVSEQPDLVITDLRMPAMDGHGVLQAVHERSIPVIVISGFGDKEDVVQALRLGAFDYLTKPIIDLGVLEISVERALERSKLLEQNKVYARDLERVNNQLKQQLKVLEQDQLAGRSVQTRMLPDSPVEYGNYRVAHRIIPSLYLSGDLIDHFVVRDRFLVFFLADVSGHGASSAFITILLHHITNNMVRHTRDYERRELMRQLTPANILMNLNDELVNDSIDKHVAVFLGVIDLRRDTLHYSVAGQFPMPLVVQGGQAQYLEGEGMAIGIMPNVVYREYKFEVKSDFKLLLSSDGLFEVDPSDSIADKLERLKVETLTAGVDIDKVLEAYGVASSQSREDDISLLSIARNV